MIDSMKLDVVHICTPNNTHFEIAMYALERGVDLICEKPMTTTAQEPELLVGKVEETGLTMALNFHNRFYPMAHHLRNVIKDGDLGGVFSITGTCTQDWLLYETDYSWRLSAEESGKTRVVTDIGSHWMGLVEFVSGQKITHVCADFSIIHPTRKKPKKNVVACSTEKFSEDDYENIPISTEDCASVMFRFPGGQGQRLLLAGHRGQIGRHRRSHRRLQKIRPVEKRKVQPTGAWQQGQLLRGA